MSNRETILSRVRSALNVAPVVPADAPIIRSLADDVDIIAMMVDRLEDYRAIVVHAEGDLPSAIEHALRVQGASRAVIDPRLAHEMRPESVELIEDHGLSARELDGIPAAITTAAVGIAETGTIILTHDSGQGRRAISLVPDLHICVLRQDQIVGTVPEAMSAIGTPTISTWISGPSATSDIELSRVEGVHGPRTLVVVLT
jgi:L-lactate dehydrogenase complex protein LldG